MPSASPLPKTPAAGRFERHARATLAAVLVLVVLVLFGMDMAATRAYRAFEERRAAAEPVLRVRSETYHHGLAPLVSTDREPWGPRFYPYRTNSLGFRDRTTRQVPLHGDRPRVVFMGDSFTEGVGIPYEKTFVGIIDDAWGARGVEVLNAGVSLYSPVIYARKTRALLDDVGLRFDAMVVFIDISDIQDEDCYGVDDRGRVVFDLAERRRQDKANRIYEAGSWSRARFEDWLHEETLVTARVYDALTGLFRPPRHRGAAWTFDDALFEEYGRLGITRALAHMDELRELLSSRGIRLTIAVYPWTDQIRHHDRESKQSLIWRDWATKHGVEMIDLFPPFFQDDAETTIRRDFIPHDLHWNEAGHRLIAESFLRLARPPVPAAR